MTRVFATAVILSAVALVDRAQSSRETPSSTLRSTTINGRVVADDTGDPIPNARVTLATPVQGTPVVLTDADGRFTFTASPGGYTVVASKSGYPRREGTLAAEGQAIEIRLRRGAAISGRVVDEFGDPVPLALVAAETLASARTRFTTVATSVTDDRGEYRLASLPGCPQRDQDCHGGTFAVSLVTLGAFSNPAVGDNSRVSGPDPRKIYYPGAAMPDGAQELRLQPGEERPGIDFVLSAARSGSQPFSVATAGPITRPIAPNPGARATVDLSPSNVATANVHADSTFEILGINGPRRLQLRRAPDGWALKEIRVNGIDVTDRPLPFGRTDQSLTDVEVVLTDRVSVLSGTIADDRARPAPGASVIVASMDRDRWYPGSRFLRKTIAGPDGAFTIAGLPMGSYYAMALARLPADGADAWQDPGFLESLMPRASTVTMGEGQKQSLSLRLAGR